MSGATVTIETDRCLWTFTAPWGVGMEAEKDMWGDWRTITFAIGSATLYDKTLFEAISALEADCE